MRPLLICLLVLVPSLLPAQQRARPNYVIVLADDLGYGDLACYGHPVIRTPHLDQFAKEGVRFTNCYSAAPNCSPARTGLMTGRTPYRAGVYNWIPFNSPMHLRAEEYTVAEYLKKQGYATCHSGKWHLNGRFNQGEQPQPGQQGFDHWFSTQNNALPNHHDPDNFVRNGKAVGRLKGYSADLVTDEAVNWLVKQRSPNEPFFLYVCYHEPHEPIATAKQYTDLYATLGDPAHQAHHGNITQMDAAFGRLMKALDDLKLRENTFVLFTSDNGPAITPMHPYGSSGPLRDKKGSLYEGGIRVPGILRWPGHVKPNTASDEPICGIDLLPTIAEINGLQLQADRRLDGQSFLPALKGEPLQRATPLYWQFLYSEGKPGVALRDGDWKLLAYLDSEPFRGASNTTREAMQAIQSAGLKRFELYNLKEDIDEKSDLSLTEPEQLKRLAELLLQKYEEIQQENPEWPEWAGDNSEAKRNFYETDARKQN